MNYLAHIFLSCNNEDLLMGNFIADSISNKEVFLLPEKVKEGVLLHRKIDFYTDTHAIVRKGTHRLQPYHHKYSPVVIDVLYDHLLANNWDRYSSSSLSVFAQNIYKIFSRRMDEMPPRLKRKLPRMIEHDWLNNYKSIEGLQFTLEKMDERTRFPSNFGGAVEHLLDDYGLFTDEFNAFFPEVIAYVNSQCEC